MSQAPTLENFFELKAIFLDELEESYRAAEAAFQALTEQPSDRQSLEVVKTLFHRVAGTANSVNLPVLRHTAAICEGLIRLSLEKGPSFTEISLKLLSDGMAAVASVIEDHRTFPRNFPAIGRPKSSEERPVIAGPERLLAKILIIDDDPYSAQLIDSCLKSAGFTSSFCCDPQQSLLLIQGELPDLIILDVEMPGLDGLGLCRYVRSHPALQFTPVVFVTRIGRVEERIRGLEVGANDYIVKPFVPEELVARVRSHLERLSELRNLANRDGLTNCYNHTYFKSRLEQEIYRARRHLEPLTLGMIDADHFKNINDTYGHPVGDSILIRLAAVIKGSVRSTDVVARYGGEEFGVLLIRAIPVEADRVMRRIRENVEKAMFDLGPKGNGAPALEARVSVSIGVAHIERHDTLQSFVARADQALYEAKRRGRNQVFVAERPAPAVEPAPQAQSPHGGR